MPVDVQNYSHAARRHRSLYAEARVGTGSPRRTVMVNAPVDRRTREARTHVRRYLTTTTFVPGPWGGEDPALEGFRDAADECEHGRLPTDRVVACDCWPTRSGGVAA